MASVTIDAGVLAVPATARVAAEAYHYVEALLDWRKLIDEPWVAIYMSERASEALFTDGLYPLRDQLRKLFAAHGVVEYDVNTVAQIVDTLLQLTPSFETYFKVRDVLTDQLSTTPDILQLCAGPELQSDLARCIVLIAVIRQHCKAPATDHALIVRNAPRQIVKIRALVHELEHDRDDLNVLPVPPERFEGDVLVCDDFPGLVACLDECSIFLSSVDNLGLETAIRIAHYKSRVERGEELEWNATNNFRLGASFADSIRHCCGGQTDAFVRRALRAIVETIDGLNMPAVHALRIGAGGNDPQITRDKDKAWRRDIDNEYHLHYWQCADGTVELASVGVHNNFAIPG